MLHAPPTNHTHHDDDDEQQIKLDELTDEDLALLGGKDDIDTNGTNEEDDDDEGNEREVEHEEVALTAEDMEEVLVTKEGLKNLQDELEELETTRRKEIAVRLKEAIAFGDLSENSEYQDAKGEQAFVEGRIAELREKIKRAKIITGKHGTTVKIGSTVTIQNLTDKDPPETYTITGSTEANPLENKISNESPIGAALLEKLEGDEVKIQAPAGVFKYKILKVK